MDWFARMQSRQFGVAANVAILLVLQVAATCVALLLDALGCSEATTVIVFVLGVLLTAVFTTRPRYSIASSVVSILSYNFFLVAPRLSFRIAGADVPGTMLAMLVVALVASFLVTELRSSVRASADAQARAQNEQLRADLLRSVSHDLRTPLTSISGNADMLLDPHCNLDESSSRALLRDIYDDATWLAGVVENLLTVTRLDNDKIRLKADVELVDDVVANALRHVSPDVSEHELGVSTSEEMLLVRMDGRLMMQVVVNLVNNAIAYTPKGSHISLAVRREGERAIVEVADDGPGIPPEDQPHVFEAFYTSNSAVADGRRGIGLGLSVCKSIVDAHGGSIEYSDAVPHGAVFSVSLPLEGLPDHG